MAIARAGGQTIGIQGATGVQSLSHTFAASVVVGNAIMAFAKAGDDNDTISFSDDQSNSWATDVLINDAVSFETSAVGSAKNVTTGGTVQVTASIDGGTNRRMFLAVEEYTFTGGASLDQTSSGKSAGTADTNALSGSGTTTVADELLFGGHGDAFNGVPTVYNNSFSLLGESGSGAGRGSAGDRIVSSTGTYEIDITLNGSVNWTCCIATYSEIGVAGLSIPVAMRYYRNRRMSCG